jgi:hypothetical protein
MDRGSFSQKLSPRKKKDIIMETHHNSELHSESFAESFSQFCKYNKISIYLVLVMIFLTYGFMLFHFSFSIDTEAIVILQTGFCDGWLGINRYGLVFTKWLTGVLSIVPGFATMLMTAATLGYSLAWMYVFWWIKGKEKGRPGASWLFPVLFFSSVPMVELTNFQCLSFEAAFAMLICAAALLLEWQWILEGKTLRLLFSILLGVWCFASYQAFVPVYISASLGSFLLGYQYRTDQVESRVFPISIKLGAVFLCDYVIYTLLGKLMIFLAGVQAGSYTDNMIQWGKKPLGEILISLKTYVYDVVLARSLFWNRGYLLAAAGLLLMAFWKLKRKTTERRFYPYYIFVTFVFLASPFFLPILLGSAPAVRGQLALPFAAAFGIQMITERFLENGERLSEHGRSIRLAAWGLLFLLILRGNIVKDNRLLYSEYVVRQQENALTQRLVEQVAVLGGSEETTVAILGKWSPVCNPSMIQGETLGHSFYEWDQEIPGCTCQRVLNYWSVLGYRYQHPDETQWKTAENLAEQMPSWPRQGSVIREGNLIVIKMSE